MRVLITGAGGMIGARLARRVARDGRIGDSPVTHMILTDLHAPNAPDAPFETTSRAADLATEAGRAAILRERPDVIFNLAAIVSGAAEADFELGYRFNLDATAAFLDDIRRMGGAPKVISTSSVAAFGGDLPDIVPDDHCLTPQNSYGTQKAMGELLQADHTRRGHLDGRCVRLPTICVRPGAPNAAASGFISGIIREPLAGVEAALPVSDDLRVWIASPDCAVETLLHAATLPPGALGPGAVVSGRGISVTIAEMLEALERVAGANVRARVTPHPDPVVAGIVGGWPKAFACTLAKHLDFPVDDGIDSIIRAHMDGSSS
ncbi:D-erythronate dehydrogenase [Hasllibacter sp. MH4015]|uniref:D-erythronate dehydrogenase n=1 Tax=Hasllibacter sp. MH4015 TaxID=2854029 RepID=UPI001CD44C0B|nr:D-erythronate dehydrogenase [Hasllibacter sp. MH4015]